MVVIERGGAEAESSQAPEPQLRAGVYNLLAGLFAGPPREQTLHSLAAVVAQPADGPVATAWASLAQAARDADAEALDDEYHALFIGLGRGEVVPFGSWYLTGFLMGRSLARLRTDLKRLGLERDQDVHEPEDHISALLEAMRLLSEANGGRTLAVQRDFFDAHLAPWVERFMRDVQRARSAVFYSAVAQLGERFIVLEKQYLNLSA